MRLGRSIAALGGALALVAAGAALTSPAAADASDFRLNDDSAIRTAPTAAVTVSGTGCAPVNGKPSTVAWGLITNGGNGNAAIRDAVTAGDDGSWTVTVDIPAAVQSGKLSDPTAGVLQFACVNYDDAVVASAKVDLVVDSTDVKGKADIVSSDTDGDGAHDTQRFDIDLTGFAPGEDVVFYLITEDGARVRDLFATTADADGRITYTGPVPTDLPAGRYRIVAQGGLYGEGLTSKPIEVTANGWWNVDDGDIPIDPSPSPTADPTTDPAPAAAPTTAAKPASGRSGLANTGAGLGIAVVAGGLLAAGGILVAHRRRTA